MRFELPVEARAVRDAVVAIGSDHDLRGVLRRIVETSCRLTGAEYGVLGTLEDAAPAAAGDNGRFVDLVTFGISDDEVRPIGAMPAGAGPVGAVTGGHAPMSRFLGAPVLVRGQAFGHLYLRRPAEEPPFATTDQALVEGLARAAGLVVENVRAHEEGERRRAWLDTAVRGSAAPPPAVSADDGVEHLVSTVRAVVGARSAALVLGDGDLLELVATVDRSAGEGAAARAAGVVGALDGAIRAVLATGDVARVGHDRPGGRNVLLVPVPTQLVAPGVLLVDGADEWSHGFEQDLVTAFADQLGFALDRAEAIRERHEVLIAKDRDRIARDLHDLVIQRIFATGMQLQSAMSLPADDLRGRVRDAVGELDLAIRDLRSTIYELGRSGRESLLDGARSLIREYGVVLGFVPVLRSSGSVDRALAPSAAEQLLLTLREALSNVARHARAGAVTVELTAGPAWIVLKVADDGCGLPDRALRRDRGLDNLRHRAEALGGRLSVTRAAGGGTLLEWAVPI